MRRKHQNRIVALLLAFCVNPRTLAFSITLSILTFPAPAFAHHGIADDIDLDQPLELNGTIELAEWINPHVVLNFRTQDENGFSQLWLLQVDSPNSLLRKGINRVSLDSLGTVDILVYPSTSAPCSNTCYGYGVELRTRISATYILHNTAYELVNALQLPQN